MRTQISMVLLAAHLLTGSVSYGRGYRFATPQVAEGVVSSTFSGVNNSGQIVGFYEQAGLQTSSFLLTGDQVEEIAFPGASTTFALGLNDSGAIVGSYLSPEFTTRAFMIKPGEEPEELPIAGDEVWAADVSMSGIVVGFYTVEDVSTAFEFSSNGGTLTPYDHPLADGETIFSGINAFGEVAGSFRDASGRHSGLLVPPLPFGRPESPVQTIVLPLTMDTQVLASNRLSQFVGFYTTPLYDLPPRAQGFVAGLVPASGGDELGPSLSVETVNYPESTQTIINDINDAGVIVGDYYDAEGFGPFGFIGTPIPDLPGDVDFDGDVDLEDFNILKQNFGAVAVGIAGDVDGDFAVTQLDVDLIRGAANPVPEPGAAGLALLTATAALAARRRRGLHF